MALDALHKAIMSQRVNWVLDADIRSVFDAGDHAWLPRMVADGMADPRSLRLIGLWLRAGVLESARSTRRTGGPRKGRESCRSSPTSFCTTSSISGLTNGVCVAHAVAS